MKILKYFFAYFVFVLLTSCANTAHITTDLVEMTSDNYIALKENAFYEAKRGIGFL